jgi:glycosyltransferase involved in cell wall biosynthesis
MRVLHLDCGREMGGGQWQVLRLLLSLRERGEEGTLLARSGSPLFERARQAGVPVEAWGLFHARSRIRSHDLVHAHDARSHSLALLLPERPLVVARRVAFPLRSTWKYRHARQFIAVSRFVECVLKNAGIPPEKINVVYDGVPLLDPARGNSILALANKGAELVIETGRIAKVPIQVTTDLERDLQRAALLVYVTECEGLGSAALLAMSAGVPVLASDVGGLREVIRNGENGWLVENSTEALSAVLQRIVRQPAEIREIGEAAARTVRERFTIDKMTARTIEVYHKVLS